MKPVVFVGCGFSAKYPEGGGNFAVPLQWVTGLKRLGIHPVWLEVMPPPSEGEARKRQNIHTFRRRMHRYGLEDHYCLLSHRIPSDAQDLEDMVSAGGLSVKQLRELLAGPNTLLNLSYSIHPPFLLSFERRILCDLDPGEIHYWMPKIEMGQSSHQEFWTIGLNVNHSTCKLPRTPGVTWHTFPPLVNTELIHPTPRPQIDRFTTIGQWYWANGIEVDGEYPDLSKRALFEKYLPLPKAFPNVRFDLAMNISPEDPERVRLRKFGWRLRHPHRAASSPARYHDYIQSATGEFTSTKGVDVLWNTGWISDRAITFLAAGRPVITEDTSCSAYLPRESGFVFVADLESAKEGVEHVLGHWAHLSRQARACAVEVFDAPKVLGKILG
jgi:hypothetical protein